jgi:transposase
MGTGAREVARLLRMSPNTEREYREAFAAVGLLEGPVDNLPELHVLRAALPEKVPQQQVSTVGTWSPIVEDLLRKGCGPRAIYDHLRLERDDFAGSYDAIKRLCAALRRSAGPKPEDVAIPVETLPGDVAQVDFGYVGLLYDAVQHVLRKAYVFVMVLGYSRHQFAKVVFDQKAMTWQQLHAEAFAYFGGVPEKIVPDNLKAAVVRMAFGIVDEPGLQRGYRDLARHYGFKVDPTPPRDPEKKGKVEAGVKYVKNNFFAPRDDGEEVGVVNAALGRWLVEVAGARTHGTTQRKPIEVFEAEERRALQRLPPLGWAPVLWKLAKVHSDSHVVFDKRLYSVPWPLLRQQVWIRATPDSVYVYDLDDNRVATHDRRFAGPRSTDEAHLPEFRRDLRHRGDLYWTERGQVLGEEVGTWVREVFDESDAFSPLRVVQQVVTLLEKYPKDRANNTCRRARHFGIRNYAGIKEILTRALDFEPLPEVLPFPEQPEAPRFARSATELLRGVSRGVR